MSLFPTQKADDIALCMEFGDWSYMKLKEVGNEIAAHIGGRTLVFLLCTNAPESIAAYWGCLNKEIVPAMIDGTIDEELLLQLIKKYQPSHVLVPTGRTREIGGFEEKFSFGSYVLLAAREPHVLALCPDLALLMTTSGSTGSPKFVRLSYENIRANTESIIEYLEIGRQERAITNLPMHYVYGLSIINTHLYTGASIVVTDKTLFQKEFWQLFKQKNVTGFGGVPYTFEMLERLRFFRMKLPSLRTITQAGGKLDPELHQKFAQYAKEHGKRFFVMYGAAEATARMGYLPAELSLRKCGSMGVAIPRGSFELRSDEGKIIENSDSVGELIYRGPNVMMGYAESGKDLVKGNELHGLLITGDLAKRDEDGFYTIVGRKKRFLKIFGKRVNLVDVEHIVRQQFSGIDVACAGKDDCLYIFVVSNMNVDSIKKFISEKIGIHSSSIIIMKIVKIPKNSSGKTLYKELERYYIKNYNVE